MSKSQRYQRIVFWARCRYMENGVLVVDVGGVPSAYSRIEDAAFNKYIRVDRDADGCMIFPSK